MELRKEFMRHPAKLFFREHAHAPSSPPISLTVWRMLLSDDAEVKEGGGLPLNLAPSTFVWRLASPGACVHTLT